MTPHKVWRARLKKKYNTANAEPHEEITDLFTIYTPTIHESLPDARQFWKDQIKVENPTIVLAPQTIRLSETINLAVANYCVFMGVAGKAQNNRPLSHTITVFPCKTDDNAVHQMIREFIDMFNLNRNLTIHVQGCYGIGDSFEFATVFTGVFKLLTVLLNIQLGYHDLLENINKLSIKYPVFSDLAEIDVILTGSRETSSFSYFAKYNSQPFYGLSRAPCKEFFKKTRVFYVNVLVNFPIVSYVRRATSYRYMNLVKAFYDMESSTSFSNEVNWASIARTHERTFLLPPNEMRAIMNKVIRNLLLKLKISGGDLQPRGFVVFVTEEQQSSPTLMTDILQEFINMKVAPLELSVQPIFQGHGAIARDPN